MTDFVSNEGDPLMGSVSPPKPVLNGVGSSNWLQKLNSLTNTNAFVDPLFSRDSEPNNNFGSWLQNPLQSSMPTIPLEKEEIGETDTQFIAPDLNIEDSYVPLPTIPKRNHFDEAIGTEALTMNLAEAIAILRPLNIDWNNLEEKMKSLNWEQQVESLETLQNKIVGFGRGGMVSSAIVVYLRNLTKQFNLPILGVLKAVIKLFVVTAENSGAINFSRPAAWEIMKYFSAKISDDLIKESIEQLFSALSEAINPNYIFKCFINIHSEFDHSFHEIKCFLEWFRIAIQEFTVRSFIIPTIVSCCVVFIQKNNPQVTEAAVAVLTELYHQMGPSFTALNLIDDLHPTVKSQLESEFSKIGYDAYASSSPTRTFHDEEIDLRSEAGLPLESLKKKLKRSVELQKLQKFQEAEDGFRAVLIGREKMLGDMHAETLEVNHYLATLYHETNRYQEAEKQYQIAIFGREAVLGIAHVNTFTTYACLAKLMLDQGRVKEAEKAFLKAFETAGRIWPTALFSTLTIRPPEETSSPETSPYTNESETVTNHEWILLIYHYGCYCQKVGSYESAEIHYRRALCHAYDVFGHLNSHTLRMIHTLAMILQIRNIEDGSGSLKESEYLYKLALSGRSQLHGERHSDTLTTVHCYASLMHHMGRRETAETLYDRALFGREEVLGGENVDTIMTASNLIRLLQTMGKLERAAIVYAKCLKWWAGLLGPHHIETLKTAHNYAALLHLLNQLDSAEVYYQQALQGREKTLGPNHPDTILSANNLASVLLALDALGEAESLYRRVLEWRKVNLGENHMDTLKTSHTLGAVLFAQDSFDEAESIYRWTLQGREKVLGFQHVDTLNTLNNLGNVLQVNQKLEEAVQCFQKAILGREKQLGLEHADTLCSVHDLATAMMDLAKFAESEELFRRALAGREKLYGDDQKLGESSDMQQDPTNIHHRKSYKLSPSQLSKVSSRSELASLVMSQDQNDSVALTVMGSKKMDHPFLLTTVHGLALLLHKQNIKYDESLRLFRRALAGRLITLRFDEGDVYHPETLTTMHHLADHLVMGHRTSNTTRQLLPYPHPIPTFPVDGDGSSPLPSLTTTQRDAVLNEAVKLYSDAANGRQQLFGPDHKHTLQSYLHLSLAFQLDWSGRNWTEASRYYIKFARGIEKHWGADSLDLYEVLLISSKLLIKIQDYLEALNLCLKALSNRERLLGKEDPSTMEVVKVLIGLYVRMIRYDEAIEQLTRLLTWQEATFGIHDLLHTMATRLLMLRVFILQNRYVEALTSALSIVDILTSLQGDSHVDTIEAQHDVIVILLLMKDFGKAEVWYRKVIKSHKQAMSEGGRSSGVAGRMGLIRLQSLFAVFLKDFGKKWHEAEELFRSTISLYPDTKNSGAVESTSPLRSQDIHDGKTFSDDILDDSENMMSIPLPFETYSQMISPQLRHPDEIFEALHHLGQLLHWKGKYLAAEIEYKKASEGRESLLGRDDMKTIRSTIGYGHVLFEGGKIGDGALVIRRALMRCMDKLSPQDELLQQIILIQCQILQYQANLCQTEESNILFEECFQRLISVEKNLLASCNSTDVTALEVSVKIIKILIDMKRFRDAEVRCLQCNLFLQTVLDAKPSSQEEGSLSGRIVPLHRQVRRHLAEVFIHQYQYPDALEILMDLDHKEKKVVDRDPLVIQTKTLLGLWYENYGIYQKSQEYYLESYELCVEIYGEAHLQLIPTLLNRARVCLYQAAFTECNEILSECQGILNENHVTNENIHRLHVQTMTGMLYSAMDQFVHAKLVLEEVMKTVKLMFGDDHEVYLDVLVAVGQMYYAMEQHEAAAGYWKQAYNGYRQVYHEVHPKVLSTGVWVGAILISQGKLLEAEPLLSKAMFGLKSIYGAVQSGKHPIYLTACHHLGILYSKSKGKEYMGEEFLSQSMKEREKLLGGNHPDSIESIHQYGVYLFHHVVQRSDECEELLSKALKLCSSLYGMYSMKVCTIAVDLGKFYLSKKNPRQYFEMVTIQYNCRLHSLGPENSSTIEVKTLLNKMKQSLGY